MVDKKKVIKLLCEELNNLKNVIGYVEKGPSLKRTLISVLSPTYLNYISDIEQKSPKPATFKVTLINEQEFTIKYLGNKNFSFKVSGKKYNPSILGEQERASQAISDLLELNYTMESKEETASSKDADLAASLENPEAPLPPEAAQAPAEQPAGEEVPIPEVPAGGEAPAATPAPEETPA
jgi:hypothetical protein